MSGRINSEPISPCYIKKIEALKMAVARLFGQLNTVDPKAQFVRTGTVSYETGMSTAYDLGWGTSASLTQVNALYASGGTSSSDAMMAAYDKLTSITENAEHQRKNGQIPKKYIVFMTDGDNNYAIDDTKTKEVCVKAKAAGIVIYSVAFMAPDRGKTLLQFCVSSPDHYFAAEQMGQLVSAFEEIGTQVSARDPRLVK